MIQRKLFMISIAIGVAVSIVAAQTPGKVLSSDWDHTEQPWASTVRGAGLSAEGRCVAITAPAYVAVADKAARELWRWNFSEGNRFIVASSVAVSPKCDWLAFVGNAGYRYAWIVHRTGKRLSIPTQGTPTSVVINNSGTFVAIGTGTGVVSLYSSDGTLRWKNDVGGGLVPVQELSFAADGSAIMVRSRGQSVISIAGKIQWAGGVWGVGSSRPARDFKAFVACGQPPHGPGIGILALLDSTGKVVWQRYASYPGAIISSAGDRVIARTNDNQSPTEEDGFSPRRDQLTSPLRLHAADGSVVRVFATPGEPIAFADDGTRFLIRTDKDFVALDLEGKTLWNIPLTDRFGATALTTSDLSDVVVLSNSNVSWFSAP